MYWFFGVFLQMLLTTAFMSCSKTVTFTRLNQETWLHLLKETAYGETPLSSSGPQACAEGQDLLKETHLERMKRICDLRWCGLH